MSKAATSDFVYDIWYFAGLSSDVKRGKMVRREIAGEPITLGRREDGSVFACAIFARTAPRPSRRATSKTTP